MPTVKGFNTNQGIVKYDYNFLANKLELDSSLSQDGQAADAKAAGDSIKDVKDLCFINESNVISSWNDGHYYNLSAANETIDINSPVSDAGWKTAVVECEQGDCFLINSHGGENQRSWAFLDENYKIILNANPSTTYTNALIKANHGAKHLVINCLISDRPSYSGLAVAKVLADCSERISNLEIFQNSFPNKNVGDVRNIYDGSRAYGNLSSTNGLVIKGVSQGQQYYYASNFIDAKENTTYSVYAGNPRATITLPVICEYDAGQRFLRSQTYKSSFTTGAGCKYIRFSISANLWSKLDDLFMLLNTTANYAGPYIPFRGSAYEVGAIKNVVFRKLPGSTSSALIWYPDEQSSAKDIYYFSIELKSSYEISTVEVKVANQTCRFTNFTQNEWTRVSACGANQTSASVQLKITVTFADNEQHSYDYRNHVCFNQTRTFGSGNELSASVIDSMLPSDDFGNQFFTLLTDASAGASPGRMVSPFASNNSFENCYVGFGEEGGVVLSSQPNSSWSGWSEIGTYGQQNISQIPVYNQVHGTLETDGMFSVKPLWGAWCINTGGNTHHGGHLFHGWTTDRQHRLTMVQNIYSDDEAAIFNYTPGGKSEGGAAVSGEGKFNKLRLGADSNKGLLVEPIYDIVSGTWTYRYTRFIFQSGIPNFEGAMSRAPSAADDTGVKGDFAFDSNYAYFCVATNTWKRIALETW